MYKISVLLLSLCISIPVQAQVTPDSVVALQDYNKDGLQLITLLIDNQDFFKKWKSSVMPKITPVENYHRGDMVIPIIIFSTDGFDSTGNAYLTYDLSIKQPNGTPYSEPFKELTVWKNKPAPNMHLIQQPVGINIEETDPIGVYEIEIIVKDHVKDVIVSFNLFFKVE